MYVSRQAEAVMLLTVSFGKSDADAPRPLTPTEWGAFASWLKDNALAPDDLLKPDLSRLLERWEHPKVTPERVQALLNRGAALGFALEKWERAGLWLLTRSDPDYPKRLKQRLGRTTPAILFGSGNAGLLNGDSVAVVGGRHADDADLAFAERLGRHVAGCGRQIVSGGAAGIDRAAMVGALEAEGTAVGVLADNLLRSATSTVYRKHLMSGDLALVSPFNPATRFHVGNAMARNKYIYCLAQDAIVVSSTPEKGGTWNGAVENLRQGWVPLAVKRTKAPDSGNPKLVELGGRWLEDLGDVAFTLESPRRR
ncbi:MAG: DNA-processing protein DprA [Gammaproteobacteria bacterium]|nr:DNA-processing protein DprA [Gammaproteobacteria bacterium]